MNEIKIILISLGIALIIELPGFYFAYKKYKREKRYRIPEFDIE